MAVRIRMKQLGRKHRHYYRIVAIDGRQPRDGRIIEELGSYDPMVKNTDERVRLGLRPREISVGDFVCNGGEVPAMVVIDTVVRYVPGVLGDPESVTEESHSEAGLVEYPQYTRPRVFRGMEVPEVLLSGNHREVARWRAEQSRARTPRAGPASENTDKKEGESHEEPADRPG